MSDLNDVKNGETNKEINKWLDLNELHNNKNLNLFQKKQINYCYRNILQVKEEQLEENRSTLKCKKILDIHRNGKIKTIVEKDNPKSVEEFYVKKKILANSTTNTIFKNSNNNFALGFTMLANLQLNYFKSSLKSLFKNGIFNCH